MKYESPTWTLYFWRKEKRTNGLNPQTKSAIDIIDNYIYFIEDMGDYYGYNTESKSYCIQAAKYLIAQLKKQKFRPPLDVIADFKHKMESYELKSKNSSAVFGFGAITADSIIDSMM